MRILQCLVVFLVILNPTLAYPFPAEDVVVVNNLEYFPTVHKLLSEAKKSIYVIMFSARYYDDYPDSKSNILFNDLADAKKRGLDVKYILEQELPEKGKTAEKDRIYPKEHNRVMDFLKKNNIAYTLDNPDITTHSKLIIVDGMYTVVGSTNWSYSALTKNNETSVIIKSVNLADSYTRYFNEIVKDSK